MSARLMFCLILFSTGLAVPAPQFRNVQAHGPSGILGLETRWRDTVGTATQVFMNGPARKHTVLSTSRTGPLSSVFREAMTTVRHPCETTDDHKCEIAVNGFGTVGEVQYDFRDAIRNVVGRSTQVMVACRCVDKECGKAVLIRPVTLFETLPASSTEAKPVQKICLYEAVGNGFSDCHTELLRSVRRPTFQRAEYTHGSDAFVYNVNEPSLEANWTAQGQRGWSRNCLLSEANSLETATMTELTNIQRNEHSTPADGGCKSPNRFVRYFRDEDPAEGAACHATYEYASAAASHLASQQDDIAIGKREESYIDRKPSLVSDTELALTCSAAGLGVLVVWDLFRKQLKKPVTSGFYLLTVIMIQILSFVLEALPLHLALGQEIDAREWRTEFAFIDGSVAVGSDQLSAQGSAERSVLVLTAILGTVQYNFTRVSLVAGFAALFDVIAVGLIVATFLKKKNDVWQRATPGKGPIKQRRWMKHVVGLRSREEQKRDLYQEQRKVTNLQPQVLRASQSDHRSGNWQSDKLAAISSGSLSAVGTSAGALSTDTAEDSLDIMGFGEALDVEDGAIDEPHRRGAGSEHRTVQLQDGSRPSREESVEPEKSQSWNDDCHSQR